MNLRIDYYAGEQKLSDAPAPPSLGAAIHAAREGLVRHNARYANIIDLNRCALMIEMVHRDVLLDPATVVQAASVLQEAPPAPYNLATDLRHAPIPLCLECR